VALSSDGGVVDIGAKKIINEHRGLGVLYVSS